MSVGVYSTINTSMRTVMTPVVRWISSSYHLIIYKVFNRKGTHGGGSPSVILVYSLNKPKFQHGRVRNTYANGFECCKKKPWRRRDRTCKDIVIDTWWVCSLSTHISRNPPSHQLALKAIHVPVFTPVHNLVLSVQRSWSSD